MENLLDYYLYYAHEIVDQKTKDWLLAMSPCGIVALLTTYISFVKYFGPKFMQNREPYRLEGFIKVYNLVQIFYCGFFVIRLITMAFFMLSTFILNCCQYNFRNFLVTNNFSGFHFVFFDLHCGDPDITEEEANELLAYGYSYYMLKVIDLLDTVIFVLRKKYNQISFLHVYHHSFMVFSGWLAIRYFTDQYCVIYIPYINCIVHVFMYTYYLLSTGKQNLWWKKYITQLQLLQFTSFLVIYTSLLFKLNNNFTRAMIMAYLPQNFLMIYMFGSFYYRTYILKEKRKTN